MQQSKERTSSPLRKKLSAAEERQKLTKLSNDLKALFKSGVTLEHFLSPTIDEFLNCGARTCKENSLFAVSLFDDLHNHGLLYIMYVSRKSWVNWCARYQKNKVTDLEGIDLYWERPDR